MSTLTSRPHATYPTASRIPCLISHPPHTGDLATQCGALGIDLRCPDTLPSAPAELAAPVLMGEGTAESVSQGLASPYCGFLELGTDGIQGISSRCFDTVRAGGLTLSLQTATIYRLEALELVAQAIRGRFTFLAPDTIDLLEISLAEALSNAVIHGNLGIPSHLRTTAAGFAEFQKLMHERLSDPCRGSRRVEINVAARGQNSLCIAVSDQGHGFDLSEKLAHSAHATAKNGRGLCLIRKAAHSLDGEDGGRTLVMTFSQPVT
jgi:anti-sigma regulatory factor (Ser/Thr protein kinase)